MSVFKMCADESRYHRSQKKKKSVQERREVSKDRANLGQDCEGCEREPLDF